MSTARRSILFGGGASPALVYNDEFISTIAAPIPAGSADGRGYRVINDAESLMTIGSGVLNVPAQASAVWGDEYYRAQPNSGQTYWTRPSGKALVAVTNFRTSNASALQVVGWWGTPSLNASEKLSAYATGAFLRSSVANATVSDAQTLVTATDYPMIAVWDSTGFHTFVNILGVWHRKWFRQDTAVAQAYCGMSNFASIASLKYFRIYAIDEVLFAPALSIAAPSVGNLANMPDGDFLLYLDNITRPSAASINLRRRKLDTSNYWQGTISSAGAYAIDEVIATVATNRISGSGVVSTDDITNISRAAVMQAWRGTTALGVAYTTAYNFLREIGLELNSLGTGGAIGALYAWKARLLTETGLGANIVVNGTFATDTNWTKGALWTISGGMANKTATASDLTAAVAPLVAGTYYKLTFTVLNYSAGTLTPTLGTGGLAPVSANGTYIYYGVASTTALVFSADALFVGSLDNVICEPITFTADSLALILDGLAA